MRVQNQDGFFKHFRPMERDDGGQQDVLELLQFHYSKCNSLMLKAAAASGYDASTMVINSEDIISIQRP